MKISLAVATQVNTHSITVVVNLIHGDTTACIYLKDHPVNGETVGVVDLFELGAPEEQDENII